MHLIVSSTQKHSLHNNQTSFLPLLSQWKTLVGFELALLLVDIKELRRTKTVTLNNYRLRQSITSRNTLAYQVKITNLEKQIVKLDLLITQIENRFKPSVSRVAA